MSARSVLPMGRPVRRRLEREVKKTRDAARRCRIRIVLLYHQGCGSSTIAFIVGCAPATVVRVVARFRNGGESALGDRRQDNGTAKVDADGLQALAEIVAGSPQDFGWRRPTWTQELLARTLAMATDVEVSETTVRRMLRRLKARWGCARPVARCPWPRDRKLRHVQRILRRVRLRGPDEIAFYEDEVDIHLNQRIGRDWMLPGQQKEVVTPGQNRKHYLAGALAVGGDDLIVVAADRKNSDLFVALLETLRRRYPGARRIHLILDNYIIHSSRKTQAYLDASDSLFALHFLPPYSPEHNRIERLWRELHANVTRNHACATLDDLIREVRWWLSQQSRRRRLAACVHPAVSLRRAA